MRESNGRQPGFITELLGDGRPLLLFVGLMLFLAGAFALFLAMSGHFLPHDLHYLGMSADNLYSLHGCRIVHFMMHDRAAFGGVLIAIGLLYLWLALFPLRRGEPWAWCLFAVSGIVGFASFLAYLGYGYLDTWHGIATLILLPCQVLGLWRSRSCLHGTPTIGSMIAGRFWGEAFSRERIGQACLLAAGIGMSGAGCVIAMLGMTAVFVPQDLAYMGVSVLELRDMNPRLIPLIAHDRAGFGGGLACLGILVSLCVWRGRPERSLWEVLFLVGLAGFGPAIAVHFAIGYDDLVHIAPAIGGAALYSFGLALTFQTMRRGFTAGGGDHECK